MPYSWLLFDIDNTLLDFSTASEQSFFKTLASHKVHGTHEMHAVYKKVNAQVWDDFENNKIDALKLRWLRFEKFFQAIDIRPCSPKLFGQQYLQNLVQFSEAYSGVIPLLEKLKSNYRLSVITNGLKEVQRPRLTKLGLDKYFDSIIVSDEIGVAKPHKAFFDHTYNSIPDPPSKDKILVIGDSLNSDILGGNNFGVKTCWVNKNGRTKDHIIPVHEISSVLELENILE